MTARTITIEHNGRVYPGQLGTIERSGVGFKPDGTTAAYLTLQLDDGFQVDVSVYSLDVLRTVGVSSWDDLVGKQVIALFDKPGLSGRSVGLAHLTDHSRVTVFTEHTEQ